MPWLYALGLLILGFFLIILDVFITPGLDLLGIVGLVAVLAGVVYAYVELGMAAAALVALVGVAGTALLVRLVVRRRLWKGLVLDSATARDEGYHASPDGLQELVGQVGVALTPLRPSGRARIGERLVDVVTKGDYIDPDSQVQVLEVQGGRVVVQERAA
jgi:membrane-bound serine protease (ClpP class)